MNVTLELAGAGRPLGVGVSDSRGERHSVALGRIWLGNESWPAGLGVLPPLAKEAVDEATADLADREGIPPSDVDLLAVEPGAWGSSGLGCERPGLAYLTVLTSGYRIVLGLGERRFDYRSWVDYLGVKSVIPCSESRDGTSDRNLLAAGPGVSQVTNAVLAVDPRRGRALVVAPGAPVAEVSLDTLQVRYHELAAPIATPDPPTWAGSASRTVAEARAVVVGDRIVAAVSDLNAPQRIRVIDMRTWRARTIDRCASSFELGHGLILAHAARGKRHCPGLAAYSASGRLRFRLFPHSQVVAVRVSGRYAVVTLGGGRTRVVDLQRGRVVKR